ncbi:MAG: DUF134 domain-containing protein [Bacteroidota bacterium]
MPRPKRNRKMCIPPSMTGFKPFGIPFHELETVTLLFEEFEAIRLTDYENLIQEEAAKLMNISRPTFTRIYEKARKTISEALVEGKVITINGGNIQFKNVWYKCTNCNHTFILTNKKIKKCRFCNSKNIENLNKTNKSSENMKNTNKGYGPGGFCICPHCNTKTPHQVGNPCIQEHCPNCGKAMVRENSYHHQMILKKNKGKDK